MLVTRHQHDVDLLLEVLDDPLAYLGMIGSRRRIRAVHDLLERERGISLRQRFDRAHASSAWTSAQNPGGRSRVAILAEMIEVLRGGNKENGQRSTVNC